MEIPSVPSIRVLLVEDNPKDAFLVSRMLEKMGEGAFAVTRVSWLEEAAAASRRSGFDVALLDLHLPDAQGLDTITEFQKSAPHVPILVLTGMEAEDLAIQAVRRGAQDCLLKGRIEPGLLRRSLLYAMERKNLLDQVTRQNEQLKELDRLKSEFVSVVTHELRTPVTAIKLSLSMLEEGPDDLRGSENRESLQMLHRNTDRLMNLVNDVLDVSKIESGRMQVTVQDIDLSELVRESVGLLAPQVRVRKGKVVADLPQEPIRVHCDPEKVRQVLVNLVNNALLHNEPGLEVHIGARKQGGSAVVWVSDNGQGIPEAEQQRIFEPYYQVRKLGEKYAKGTGLGLAIARGLVEAHQKVLSLRSECGRGTIFSFELDVLPDQPPRMIRTQSWMFERVQVVAESYGKAVRLQIKGPLLGKSHPLQEVVRDILANWSPRVVFDLSACTELDSRMIGFLIECRAMAMERDGDIALAELSPPVKLVLDRIGVLSALPHFTGYAAGLRALERKPQAGALP